MRARHGVVLLVATACVPSFDDRPWRVDRPRVLAVASMPAEVRPSDPLTLHALVVTPDGPAEAVPEFSYCTQPRTAGERTAVTASCLRGEDLQATAASSVMLTDGCARFGPNPPPTQEGAAPQRAADPDPTGGYHVPVFARDVDLGAEGFGAVRIRCDLAGATRAIFDAFEMRYTANVAPTIADVAPCDEPRETEVPAGAVIDLCVTTEAGAAEPFVRYSASEARLVDARESLTARWYTTDGELAVARTTVAPITADAVHFETQWRAPEARGVASVWVVLTDSRGGTTWGELRLDVAP